MFVKSVVIAPLKIRILQVSSLLLFGGLGGCQSGVNVPVTKIGDIQKHSNAYSTVYLKGKIGNQAPFVNSGAYELEDESGKIWVISNQKLPEPGEQILLKGQVKYQSIPIGGKDLGETYIQEQEQLERQSKPKGKS